MTTTTKTQLNLKDLNKALERVKAPFCSGVLNVNETALQLYYGTEKGQAGRIDMNRASEDELMRLTEACEPATFGRNEEDILDPSYRKAGKLDEKYFATKLDLHASGLVDIIRYGLLEGSQGSRQFQAELYKLNVYDKGSFFKAHKDTPRGKEMFGSLVIILPTEHEGGTLLLRHGGQEWSVDSGRLIAEKHVSNPGQPCVVFATFFSDVEHEVMPVVSGYRVTLTYNLYFNPSSEDDLGKSLQVTAQTIPPEFEVLKTALSNLLEDPTFLPEGGSIGFGLYHQYPIVKASGSLDGLDECLKGRDALIMQVCKELSLDANLWLLYKDRRARVELLAKNVLPVDSVYDQTFSYVVVTMERFDIRVVKPDEHFADSEVWKGRPQCNLVWANKVKPLNTVETKYAAYGNETFLACIYADVCLVVDVGPAGNRVQTQKDSEGEALGQVHKERGTRRKRKLIENQ